MDVVSAGFNLHNSPMSVFGLLMGLWLTARHKQLVMIVAQTARSFNLDLSFASLDGSVVLRPTFLGREE